MYDYFNNKETKRLLKERTITDFKLIEQTPEEKMQQKLEVLSDQVSNIYNKQGRVSAYIYIKELMGDKSWLVYDRHMGRGIRKASTKFGEKMKYLNGLIHRNNRYKEKISKYTDYTQQSGEQINFQKSYRIVKLEPEEEVRKNVL